MTEHADAAKQPNVAHSNPATQAGFTMIPNAVLLRSDLSLQARVIYGYLKHLAWRNGGGETEQPGATIAADLSIGRNQVTKYISELVKAGLVTSKRRGLGLPNAYVVHDPRGESSITDSGIQGSPKPRLPSRAQGVGRAKTLEAKDGEANASPPAAVKIDGRNLGFDALMEECGIDEESPRAGQVAAALNGKGKTTGIRTLHWRELTRWAEQHGKTAELAAIDPERFERSLERGIQRKALLYRRVLNGATMSPTALRDWWLDLEKQPARRDGGMTPEEMERFGEAVSDAA